MNFLEDFRLSDSSFAFCKGAVEYVHISENKNGTAYDYSEKIELRFKIPRLIGAASVKACFTTDEKKVHSCNAVWTDSDRKLDCYTVTLNAGELDVGLYFLYLEIDGLYKLYGIKNKADLVFSKNREGECFQLSVCNFKYLPPKEKYGGVIYHIFVDRFCRGGDISRRNDAEYVSDWHEDIPEYPAYPGAFLKNNTFYGGTLYGIVDKLDYISSLGVNIIYLSPVFEAYSNHKYDVGDYNKIDDGFGGEEALELLLKECQARGISVVLDGVFNHTGADSIYFNKFGKYGDGGAHNSKESPYYCWYDFKNYPDKYTCWWGIDILPRINPDIKSCSDFFVGENGVIEKYTTMGIDGFRLDVVDELSDNFVSQIRVAQNRSRKNTFLYGEVWEDASNKIAYGKRKQYYLGSELDGVMNYPLRKGIIDYVLNKRTDSLEYALFDVFPNMPKRIRDFSMNLLGTHDTERILTVLGGIPSNGKANSELRDMRMSAEEYNKAKRRLMLSYTVLATLPGLPTVFYGDEAGMEGYSDPFNRRPFPWDRVDDDIKQHYTRLGQIRAENSVYREGDLSVILLNENYFVFTRSSGNEKIVTFANNSSTSVNIVLKSKTQELISGRKSNRFNVEPESAIVFLQGKNDTFEF